MKVEITEYKNHSHSNRHKNTPIKKTEGNTQKWKSLCSSAESWSDFFFLLFSRLLFCFAISFHNWKENWSNTCPQIPAQCCLQWEDVFHSPIFSPGRSLAPLLGTGLWGSQHYLSSWQQGNIRTPKFQSPRSAPQPQLPEPRARLLAVCSPWSSGASGLMNYESSLGVPTGAYGSAETRGLET